MTQMLVKNNAHSKKKKLKKKMPKHKQEEVEECRNLW